MSRMPKDTITDYPVQRKWPRLRVTAPIVAQFDLEDGTNESVIAGSTRDISAGGVYVVSQERVQTGARSQIHVAHSLFTESMNTTGAVVRLESTGFAIEFDQELDEVVRLLQRL